MALSYYLERIQRGVDFIEQRLDSDFSLAEVARAGGLSQWHFQRLFKSLTGETLKSYVRARRLALSLDRLLKTEQRILDIALLAGFESQEAYARAFRAAFGLSPTEYRRIGKRSLFIRKLELDSLTLEHLASYVSLEPEFADRPALRLVGLRTELFGPDSEKNNIGECLPALWEAFLARLPQLEHTVPGVCYGAVRQLHEDSDLLVYDAAIEVTSQQAVPEGMVCLEVPRATYVRFEHRGLPQGIDRTVSYAYATWLARSSYRHTGGPDLEIYGAGYQAASEASVIHYAIPVADG